MVLGAILGLERTSRVTTRVVWDRNAEPTDLYTMNAPSCGFAKVVLVPSTA
jgi:hypothetical protein